MTFLTFQNMVSMLKELGAQKHILFVNEEAIDEQLLFLRQPYPLFKIKMSDIEGVKDKRFIGFFYYSGIEFILIDPDKKNNTCYNQE